MPEKKAVEIKELASQQPISPVGVENLITLALQQGTPVETMERLLAMRKELKAEAAKEAFDLSMSALQGELPVIRKTKVVFDKQGKERYRFAPLESIVEQSKEHISRNGFSYAITTDQGEKGEMRVTCTVKHKLGHSEDSTIRVPIDSDAYMSAPQKVGAASTFAKRYAFCNAFGIMTGDEDTDASPDTVGTPEQPARPSAVQRQAARPQAQPQAQQSPVSEPQTVEEYEDPNPKISSDPARDLPEKGIPEFADVSDWKNGEKRTVELWVSSAEKKTAQNGTEYVELWTNYEKVKVWKNNARKFAGGSQHWHKVILEGNEWQGKMGFSVVRHLSRINNVSDVLPEPAVKDEGGDWDMTEINKIMDADGTAVQNQ